MHKYLIAASLFLTPLLADSHWDEAQVEKYVHYSELQRRSSWQLLSKVSFRKDETVLDIGCGDGRNTALMANLVCQGKVIGIDPCNAMIAWAQRQYHPLEFPNLQFASGDFESSPLDEQLLGNCDKVTSFFSLHLVEDRVKALEKIASYLKSDGLFVCVVPPNSTNPDYLGALKSTMSSPKWNKYFETFTSSFHFGTFEDYQIAFANAGLTLVHSAHQRSIDPFVTKREFVRWFKSTMPQIHCLPKERREEFILDILEDYVKRRPSAVTQDGAICFYWGRLEFIATKAAKDD